MSDDSHVCSDDPMICPHCNERMKKWRVPDYSTWSSDYFYVCFNDQCPYFVKGWEHLEQSVQQHMSYRHYYDPFRKACGPLPAYSKSALKGDIIED